MDERHYSDFERPPPAPCFEPTEDEFRDPLAFIAKIRPIAENYGILKIRPPASWQPPFAMDFNSFRFTPRVQCLNELEAISRVRMNFLHKIANFWQLQGCKLQVPLIDGKYVDLFKLHKVVHEAGGFDECIAERRWPAVSKRMGFRPMQGVLLKAHYEKLLRPYDLHESGVALLHATTGVAPEKPTSGKTGGGGAYHGRRRTPQTAAPSKMNASRINPRALRNAKNKGAGGPVAPSTSTSRSLDPMADVLCAVCADGGDEERLLLCESCDKSFHTFCLLPPLKAVPDGDWRCPTCVAEEVCKLDEAFGFEQAPRNYNLAEFGEMADQFKRDYFGQPALRVPLDKVEREYWKQVIKKDDGVAVKYGADLFTDEVGSGFPQMTDKHLQPEDIEYAKSPWNLNNLPVLSESVLSHMSTDIRGMMVPWCYVGMVFSTFCWHTEDHWSYSINYLHWGEPKVWYGVAGRDADAFEAAVKEIAPELFVSQPDLMHHIVTIINPRVLMDKGIKIHTVTQESGEFVVTLPRAYHAGFNQGFNFAEAVNFCPADWLPMGRLCVQNYASMRRQCVFAHDELVCGMATAAAHLDMSVAVVAYRDLANLVDREKVLRRRLLEMGVNRAEREIFELVNDDHRQCKVCLTTCFMSALTCACQPDTMVCLAHTDDLCTDCAPRQLCLRFRYRMEELAPLMNSLLQRTKGFDEWITGVKRALAAADGRKTQLATLRELQTAARRERFPMSETQESLARAIAKADRCVTIADQLLAKTDRSKTRQQGLGKVSSKLRLPEIENFAQEIDRLPCQISQGEKVKEYISTALSFKASVNTVLEGKLKFASEEQRLEKLQQLFDTGVTLDLYFDEISKLKQELSRCQWLCEVDRLGDVSPADDECAPVKTEGGGVTMETLRGLLETGTNFSSSDGGCVQLEQRLARLQHLLTAAEANEETAARALCSNGTGKPALSEAEQALARVRPLAAIRQTTVEHLRSAVAKANDWIGKYDQLKESGASVAALEQLNAQLRSVAFDVGWRAAELRAVLPVLTEFVDRVVALFQKYPGYHAVAEILSPRTDLAELIEGQKCALFRSRKRSRTEEWAALSYTSQQQMMESLSRGETQEALLVHRLRADNRSKADHAPVCLCQRSRDQPTCAGDRLLPCVLCCDVFHEGCVEWDACFAGLRGRFLCPRCARGQRPPLDNLRGVISDVKARLADYADAPKALQLNLMDRFLHRNEDWRTRAAQWVAAAEPAEAWRAERPADATVAELEQMLVEGLLLELETDACDRLLDLLDALAPVADSQRDALEALRTRPRAPSPDAAGGAPAKRPRDSSRSAAAKRRRTRAVSYHDDEQRCSAVSCLQPIGREVNWVQCEAGCEQWFHILCVGLTVQKLEKIDSYVCFNCVS